VLSLATIKDVAKRAGVSIGVVSRAFNNYPDISEKTRQKILKVAEELNYTPNLVAKNLSSKKQLTIGLITSGILDSSQKDSVNSIEVFKGVYTAIEEKEYELAIYLIDSNKQKRKSYAQFCRERNIGGTILQGIRTDDPYFKELINTNIPCVLIDFHLDNHTPLIGNVSINNIEASRKITELVLKQNHRRIAIMAGKKAAYVNNERLRGVREAFAAFGLQLHEGDILYGQFLEQVAYQETKKYLEKHRPTAIIAFSDIMAIGVMKAIKEAGLRIPEDVSVTGFDNIPITEFTQPPITTVQQNFFELGRQAALHLQEIMEGLVKGKQVVVDYKIIERDSVKPL
jgi:LacI family transcriptional regulator/LacI family purine nucleotide synthesis repressor